ncbi:MAG: hypothetical protein AB1486_25950 [Planctomycetota bacterium]
MKAFLRVLVLASAVLVLALIAAAASRGPSKYGQGRDHGLLGGGPRLVNGLTILAPGGGGGGGDDGP